MKLLRTTGEFQTHTTAGGRVVLKRWRQINVSNKVNKKLRTGNSHVVVVVVEVVLQENKKVNE